MRAACAVIDWGAGVRFGKTTRVCYNSVTRKKISRRETVIGHLPPALFPRVS